MIFIHTHKTMEAISLKAYTDFCNVVDSKCGTIIGAGYTGSRNKVWLRCHNNHEWEARPDAIKGQNQWCPDCAGNSPSRGRKNFHNKVTYNKGKVIGEYMIYTGAKILLHCDKHEFLTRHINVKTKRYQCKIYSKHDSETAEKGFKKIMTQRRELQSLYKMILMLIKI